MSKKPTTSGSKEPRRTKAAKDLEHLTPGGKEMSDPDVEIALDWGMRGPKK